MSDADYELWAAMMADDEEAAKAPVVVPAAPVAEIAPEPIVASIEDLEIESYFEDDEDEDELEFPTAFFKEPQTNSITMPEVPDALTADIITESGEILKTGAIDLPMLNNTGSIPIITITPDEVDEEAIIADMGDETTGGIPPIRSGSVMNSSARVGVLPIKNRRSEGQTIILATTSIMLVVLGAGLIAAYMFKLI
ncbi:MAG: hypothetical protein RIS31_118 [Actinomycetota bacterium]